MPQSTSEMVRDFHLKYGFVLDQKLDKMNNHPSSVILSEVSQELLDISKHILPQSLEDQEDGDERLYRAHLLIEELGELCEGLAAQDEVKVSDAIADLRYVTEGTAEVYDIPLDAVVAEVHSSNMSKQRSTGDPRMRVKGPNYRKPDIAAAIARGRQIREWNRQLAGEVGQ